MENRKRRLRERAGFKAMLAVLASACAFVLFMCVVFTMICWNNDVYFEDGHETFRENTVYDISNNSANLFLSRFWNAAESSVIITRTDSGEYTYDRDRLDRELDFALPRNSNFIFRVTDRNGKLIYSTLESDSGEGVIDGYTYFDDYTGTDIRVYSESRTDVSLTCSSIEEAEDRFSEFGNNAFTGKIYGTVLLTRGLYVYQDDGYITPENITQAAVPTDILLREYDEDGSETIYSVASSAFESSYYGYMEGAPVLIDQSYSPISIYNSDSSQSEVDEIPDNDLPPVPYDEQAPAVTSIISDDTLLGYYYPYIKIVGSAKTEGDLGTSLQLFISDNPQIADSIYIGTLSTDIIARYADFYPIVGAVSAIALIVILISICCLAGYRYPDDQPSPCWFDKIPIELFAVAIFFSVELTIESYLQLVYSIVIFTMHNTRLLTVAASLGFALSASVISVLTVATVATRLKCGVFMKYSVIGFALRISFRFIKWLGRMTVKAVRFVKYLISQIRMTWKVVLLWACMAVYSLILLLIIIYAVDDKHPGLAVLLMFLLFLGAIAFLEVLIIWAGGFTKISKYAKSLASGEVSTGIDKRNLVGDLYKCAEDLESVGEGVKKAVDERMRSERLKTELITNVSHDLKTPLTSIVNYVDILSKDNIESPEAREHIDILKRQAAKMKKLIEDLLEVSKASSGNVNPSFERTDVNLLLTQTVAEYARKFEDAGLQTVVNIPEAKMIASLDGRLMWRVLDNLMGNICKYALSGTRVYITAEDRGFNVHVTFRNISREPLEISGEDLMERFVRADTSRSTEGSGLGLSIAKSLCDLQNVGFGITVDGDLFKAELIIMKVGDAELFDTASEQESQADNVTAAEPAGEDAGENQKDPEISDGDDEDV